MGNLRWNLDPDFCQNGAKQEHKGSKMAGSKPKMASKMIQSVTLGPKMTQKHTKMNPGTNTRFSAGLLDRFGGTLGTS